jgi:AraC family transcriptional regulator
MLINKTILNDNHGNAVRLSKVQQLDGDIKFKGFSAKFVVSGKETYFINNKKFVLKENEFVIGNKSSESSILIDSKIPSKGLCIDISEKIIKEVIDYNFKEFTELENFLFSDQLFVNKYNIQNSTLGKNLGHIALDFNNLMLSENQLNTDLFYSLAECVVKDQSQLQKQFAKINAVKTETNKQLFHLVWDAKNYLDSHFLEKINIENLAKTIGLSEYHFIRLFKKAFSVSPYQYLISRRLDFSKILLLDNHSVQETAFIVGFADVFSFSKSFKSAFGVSPNGFKKISNF